MKQTKINRDKTARKTPAPRRKRTAILLSAAVLLSVCLAVGTTIAFLTQKTEPIENVFTPAHVSCEIEEKFDSGTGVKKVVSVKNTSDIDVYIRVRLVSYRVNSEGKVVPGEVVYPEITSDKWFSQNGYYYHKAAVEPGENTALLINEFVLERYEEDGQTQALEVLAEAIQSLPDEAVEDNWAVTVNANGLTGGE